MDKHEKWMSRALKLAEKGKGYTGANPMVGAVVVRGDEVVAEGYHHAFGEPHAEVEAISCAKAPLDGTTMYVTLEPCCHYGKQPPCTEAIIRAGIGRVVVAMKDPNPQVAGKGLQRLREAGVAVEVGVLEKEARALNKGFIHYVTQRRPYVLLKSAVTLDGKVATRTGHSRWVSGEASRALVHQWRHEYQGIMVGIGTVLKDNPRLTCRMENGTNPLRIVIDSKLRFPADAAMLKEEGQTLIYTTEVIDEQRREELMSHGEVAVISFPAKEGQVDLTKVMEDLGKRQIATVMAEGGPRLAKSLWEANLVEELALFIAPKVLGDQEAPGFIQGRMPLKMEEALPAAWTAIERVGDDLLLTASLGGDHVYRNH